MATRTGPNATRGFRPKPSMSASRNADSIAAVSHSASSASARCDAASTFTLSAVRTLVAESVSISNSASSTRRNCSIPTA